MSTYFPSIQFSCENCLPHISFGNRANPAHTAGTGAEEAVPEGSHNPVGGRHPASPRLQSDIARMASDGARRQSASSAHTGGDHRIPPEELENLIAETASQGRLSIDSKTSGYSLGYYRDPERNPKNPGSWDPLASWKNFKGAADFQLVMKNNKARSRTTQAKMQKNGTFQGIVKTDDMKHPVLRFQDAQLTYNLLVANRTDIYARTGIGRDGIGGGGLNTKTADAFLPPAVTYAIEGGKAMGVRYNDELRSISAAPYEGGGHGSSVVRAILADGGSILDSQSNRTTLEFYGRLGFHIAACQADDVRKVKPDYEPLHALLENPELTMLFDPNGNQIRYTKADPNDPQKTVIDKIPDEAFTDDTKTAIREDWKVVNVKLFMYHDPHVEPELFETADPHYCTLDDYAAFTKVSAYDEGNKVSRAQRDAAKAKHQEAEAKASRAPEELAA